MSSSSEYPNIAACYAFLFPEATRLYVSPDIATSAANNPYMRNLYADLSGCSINEPTSLARAYPVEPVWRRLLGEHSVWHHHWLQCSSLRTFSRAFFRLLASAVYRSIGGQVLWTVHNLEPHVQRWRWANRVLTFGMRTVANRLHVHTRAAAREVCQHWGVAPERIVIVPHPSYRVEQTQRATARLKLAEHYGIHLGEAQAFLVFGMIARYKQVLETLEVFDGLDPNAAQLVIAGAVRGNEVDYQAELEQRLGRGPVSLCARFIPEDHVSWFFGAADVVLFNYRQILTSGAVHLARDYARPVWIPDHAALTDLVGDDVVRFADQDHLRERVRQHLAEFANE